MKKTLALILACCLITGCGPVSERFEDPENSSSSVVLEHSTSEDDPLGDPANSAPVSEKPPSTSTSGTSSGDPQSSAAGSSTTPQSSALSSSSTTQSKPQSSMPSSSSTTQSKPQSSVSSSSSTTQSKPQSSVPSSSSTTQSAPQSIVPSSSSTTQSTPSSSATPSSTPSSSTQPPPASITGNYGQRSQEAWEIEYADEVFRLVNVERVKEGLPEFKKMASLTESATVRAWECVVSYGHQRPDGAHFSTALDEQGVQWKACGENIAAGQKSPQQVVDAWINSAGHRANILSEKFDCLGVGFYYDYDGIGGTYRYFWAQNFCG